MSTYLAPGYWYNPNQVDMSGVMELAITDSNNTIIRNPSIIAQSEFTNGTGMVYTQAGDEADIQNFISSNGSLVSAAPVPEPCTLLLFGSGLCLIGIVGKSKRIFE